MPFPPLPKLRSEVVATSRRLHEMGWVANHDGNVSVRLTGDRLLITPTAMSKREVHDGSLLIVDIKGAPLEGKRKPFSELDLHLAVYRARPDLNAVLHAHPPYATAFALAGREIAPIAMPEVIVSLGPRIPTLPRMMPKDPDGVRLVESAAAEYDALLLAGNGALTVGTDLTQALLRMELCEHYAKVLHLAQPLGEVKPLVGKELEMLLEARRKAGLGRDARLR